VAKIPVLLTICCAVGLVGFGLVVWLQARRKGDRATGPAVLVGFPGLFLSLLASIGGPQWLYIPAGILVVSAYLIQFVMRPRRRVKSGADPRDDVNGRGVSGK
jgi:hypothetical protein